jgi:CBS-domain-containing membrane protein
MRIWRSRTLWGILLVVMGTLFLLESLQILALGGAWAALFVAAGLTFGVTFLERSENWWAAIPGMTLLSIGTMIGVAAIFPKLGNLVGGGIILGGLALSFWLVYLRSRFQQWWAIIPGGILLSLALGITIEPFLQDDVFAAIFMLGMALTFALVYLLPTAGERMSWALYPAGALALVGLIILSVTTQLAGLVWPVLLIAAGAYVLLRSLRR